MNTIPKNVPLIFKDRNGKVHVGHFDGDLFIHGITNPLMLPPLTRIRTKKHFPKTQPQDVSAYKTIT